MSQHMQDDSVPEVFLRRYGGYTNTLLIRRKFDLSQRCQNTTHKFKLDKSDTGELRAKVRNSILMYFGACLSGHGKKSSIFVFSGRLRKQI